ncbi:unnamed protein product, partial [Agarophyton chilense]
MTLSASSRFTLNVTVFLPCVSFAIVLPSLWPYLQRLGAQESFLAYVVAIYSVGEGLGAMLFGWLFSRLRATTVLQHASALGIIGSVLYLAAYDARDAHGRALVLVSRLLCGLWTGGAQAVQQAYLHRTLSAARITSATVELSTSACVGFVAGPALALAFVPFGEAHVGRVHFDQFTLPAWFMLLSSVGCVLLYSFGLTERRDCAARERDESVGLREGSHEGSALLPVSKAGVLTATTTTRTRRVMAPLVACNVAFFAHMFGFSLQETVTTPLIQTYYGWGVTTADALFTAASGGTLGALLTLRALSRRGVSDGVLSAASLALGGAAWGTLAHTPLRRMTFAVGFALGTLAFALGRATVMALATKVL